MPVEFARLNAPVRICIHAREFLAFAPAILTKSPIYTGCYSAYRPKGTVTFRIIFAASFQLSTPSPSSSRPANVFCARIVTNSSSSSFSPLVSTLRIRR